MLTIIHTEDMNREIIELILDERFEGYTILEQTGTWKGKKEKSLQIQIVDADPDKVVTVVNCINTLNLQECCLVLNLPCTVSFL
jgi:uncharacterized membrane-anchored protein YitT (DUF2179 family)